MNKTRTKLHLALIDDNIDFLEQAKAYIAQSDYLECLLTATSVEDFLKQYNTQIDLDVILLDLVFDEGINGIRGISFINRFCVDVEVVILTVYQDYDKIFKAITAGAVGYLLKTDMAELEYHLLKMKETGGSPLSPPVARRIVEYFGPKNKKVVARGGLLTEKESQIVQYLADSMTYQEVADYLDMSIDGVRYHIRSIYKKLKIKSKAGLFKWLRENNK